ncbi:MAG: ABC transporter permease [Deltaproteobacteria bacterium]|jgi:NitT/TauT family transport system permease protein|nr:ABC transporter permease [Deltaproteobacteria bacterium]
MSGIQKIFLNKTVQSWLWLALILLVWEAVSRAGIVNRHILPPFSLVLERLCNELLTGKLGPQICNSLLVILQGFALSAALAAVLFLLCIRLPFLTNLVTMLCAVCNPLPGIALLPLIIMWFGVSTGAMLALIVHGVLWALMTQMLEGYHGIPAVYREWGRNINLTPMRMLTGIVIFAVMPGIIAGLRIGWGRAWRALISAEMLFGMIGQLGGLGYYIYTSRAYANLTNVMAGVLSIIVIGITVESLLFAQWEKRTIRKWGMAHE